MPPCFTEIQNFIISWSLYPRRSLTTTSPTSLLCLQTASLVELSHSYSDNLIKKNYSLSLKANIFSCPKSSERDLYNTPELSFIPFLSTFSSLYKACVKLKLSKENYLSQYKLIYFFSSNEGHIFNVRMKHKTRVTHKKKELKIRFL